MKPAAVENAVTLRLERVTKRFDDFTAVGDLSLRVRAGRIFGLIGPNGAGKTTTIRMIVGITAPDEGTVELFGEPVSEETQERIGYLPEERGLYAKMKVGEQLRFFGELKSLDRRRADEAIDRWLDKVKLADWKQKKASELSKGMQQKVQFVVAVLHDPDLVILDEPFSGLDPVSAELLKGIVLELKSAGKTVIFSTHQMAVAEEVCDDICLIDRSRKVLDGSLREVKRGFGRNAVALRAEGHGGVLEDESLVAGVVARGDFEEVLLADGADQQELLRRLVEGGAVVSKFERVEPSLHDIFIAQVGGAR
ncbi:MAG TPA: ATP-binding cassette domain-containing protein [Pyrinomonadaceae bacterium]|nr:ATP-binding cassette domain-containing protein [Pyrinomonadaceae bacterium]